MHRGSTGSGFFLSLVEEAFVGETLLQLLESDLQRAGAYGLDVADVNLIFATRFIHAERATHGDVQSVFRAKFQPANLVAKTHAANLRLRVFQREIQVA